MTAHSDDELLALQSEVERLLGRCLLRLQQYEHLMKAIMAHHEISGPASALETKRAARTADTARKTLGALVGDLLGSHVVTNKTDIPIKTTIAFSEVALSFGVRTHLNLSDADFARKENELKELVLLRNDLVHHFIDQHDLKSLAGCRGAQDALLTSYNRIDQYFDQLRTWAEDMDRARRLLAEFVQSDVAHDLLVSGITPDGKKLLPYASIVQALREAAGELAADGWTTVEEAGRWVAERYPEQLPAKYGCSSWRQVVHKAHNFELRYFLMDGKRSARYRERE